MKIEENTLETEENMSNDERKLFVDKMKQVVNLLEPEFRGSQDTLVTAGETYVFYIAKCENVVERNLLYKILTAENSPLISELIKVRAIGRDLGQQMNQNSDSFMAPTGEA